MIVRLQGEYPLAQEPLSEAVSPAQAMLRTLKANPSESIGTFRMEVADLRKFAVLNYIAVIKCVSAAMADVWYIAPLCSSIMDEVSLGGGASVQGCNSGLIPQSTQQHLLTMTRLVLGHIPESVKFAARAGR